MEIIALGSNLPIILDYVFPDGSKWLFFSTKYMYVSFQSWNLYSLKF